MSNSTHDHTPVASAGGDTDVWLESLLSAVAAAPDFSSAAAVLLSRFCAAADSRRGYITILDTASRRLNPVASFGYEDRDPPTSRTIDDASDPFVVALLGMRVVSCSHGPPRSGVPRNTHLIAVPFPQPRIIEAPSFLTPAAAAELVAAPCRIERRDDNEAWSTEVECAAYSPYGVFVIEMSAKSVRVDAIARAARLAGPMLSRFETADAHRLRATELAEQRTVLTSIVNSLPDPIVLIDGHRRIMVQNQRAEHILSIREGDSEGRRRAVEINNLLLTSHLSKDASARGNAAAASRELNLVDPDDGTDLLFEVLTQPLDENETIVVSVLRDVTDLRRAAGELELQVQRVRLAEYEAKRESDRLNLILTNVADPILVTDDRSNIILMNRQAELLFGSVTVNIGFAIGDRSAAVRSNDTKFTTFISDFGVSPEVARRENMELERPGEEPRSIPMQVLAGKIIDKRGEPLAIVSVLHDLTEQAENERLYEELKNFSNELEARVLAATADLGEQNVRLQWQSRELEKANRLKSEFLASMSHELRTPINALIGYTALMLDRIYGDLNDRQEEGLTRIRAAAQHLLELINDILDLAKIEAGRMPLHIKDTVLQEVMREASVQVDPLLKKRGLTYRWTGPEEPLHMMTDHTKVKQIILNLLSNAIKFTHSGSVTLSAVLEHDLVRLDVTDTGIGIRREDLAAIWDDFRQVDQSRTREFGGTGLGLSITRKLSGALGGKVSLTSEYGRGSTFSVFLPVNSEPPGERDGSEFGASLTGQDSR